MAPLRVEDIDVLRIGSSSVAMTRETLVAELLEWVCAKDIVSASIMIGTDKVPQTERA